MKEYDRLDACFYDYYSTGLEGDVEFYAEEAEKAGSPVLELACGTGRILIPVAEKNIKITGLDLSPSMMCVAKKKISKLSPEIQKNITLIEGDMRNFSIDEKYNLIMIPYRAFLHLLTVEDQKQCLNTVYRHLSEKGLLIFNMFDPLLNVISSHFEPLGSSVKKVSEFTRENGNKVIVSDTRQYDQEKQILEQYFIFEELNKEGRVIDKIYTPLILRYVFRYEMEHLLELCGYRVISLYGDFKRGSFKYGCEQIWVAGKM